MILATDMTYFDTPKDLVTPKPLGARVPRIGIKIGWQQLKNAAASWKMSFKFVSNAVSSGGRNGENVLAIVGSRIQLNVAKTTSNAPGVTRFIGLCSAVFRLWETAAPKPIVVNPMLTESA